MPKDTTPVSLDLNALEREDAPEPFWTLLGEKRYLLIDPQDLPFDHLLTLTLRPADILPAVVEEKDRDEFRAALGELPAWKVNKLAAAYSVHHGLPSGPEAPALPA